MMEYEYKLKEMISESMENLGLIAQIAMSCTTEISPRERYVDCNASLSCYRELVETVTLLKVYNSNFPGSELEKTEKRLERILRIAEEELLKS